MVLIQKPKLLVSAKWEQGRLSLGNGCLSRLLSKLAILPRLAVLLLLLSMAACQTAPKGPAQSSEFDVPWLSDSNFFKNRLAHYQQTNRWRYSAKVGVKTPDIQEQANLIWQFADQSNNLRLFGPLGIGTIKLDFDQYGVQLSDNRGALHQGVSAEKLLTRIVGWPIPIDALSYWLHGLPFPGQEYEYRKNELGDLNDLRQFDWSIQYSGYRDYDGQRLARKLTATKKVSTEQVITVKLIAKGWQWP